MLFPHPKTGAEFFLDFWALKWYNVNITQKNGKAHASNDTSANSTTIYDTNGNPSIYRWHIDKKE